MYVYSVAIVMVVDRGGRLCLMRVGVSGVGHVLTCEGEPPELPPMEIPDSLLASSSICMEPKPAKKKTNSFCNSNFNQQTDFNFTFIFTIIYLFNILWTIGEICYNILEWR